MSTETISKQTLYEHLNKLTAKQFKAFYTALVHYWARYKFFISKQNFLNLWCEFNLLCHEFDEGFPDPFDDHEAVKDFCHFHPYYFIDRLPLDLIAKLIVEHVDDRVDVLADFAKHLLEADMRAAYTYMNDALGLAESVDALVSETETHIKFFR
jgi:hypothetical protein